MLPLLKKNNYSVIGLMSGTSLDGLDIAYCKFDLITEKWQFEIKDAVTVAYSKTWQGKLRNAINLSGKDLIQLNVEYGNYLGEQVKEKNKKRNIKLDLVSSHGHTVFHQPEKGFTSQIGNGANIAAVSDLPVVCDFRSKDIALGGQGAPLVPIGDALLFSEYDACLNIGGFANISFERNKERYAFDICPVNIVLNELCKQLGFAYDKNGEIARQGNVVNGLLKQLNAIPYYNYEANKSLGKEWVDSDFTPLLDDVSRDLKDLVATTTEHAAKQIANVFNNYNLNKVLVTGGGAFNSHLISQIKKYCNAQLLIPDNKIIEFKEALIFGLLGVLYVRGEKNVLKSATGATIDSIGGCMYI